jgi:site-specific DNA-methyltransferase (adenine-specific)
MGKAWDGSKIAYDVALWSEALRVLKPGGHLLAFGGTRTWHRLAVAVEDAGFEIRDSIAWMYGSGFPKHRAALKPAFEPIVMARKPFKGSLSANEAIHGTGALSIDGCRIAGNIEEMRGRSGTSAIPGGDTSSYRAHNADGGIWEPAPAGRWPANVVLDEHMAGVLDGQSGVSRTAPRGKPSRGAAMMTASATTDISASRTNPTEPVEYSDEGGASRFFYVAKAAKRERPVVDGVAHPTVKPVALMRWLVRLVTPPGGTVLEPFAGSGATVEACILEGFHCIAIEREAEYLPLIQARINRQDAA